MRIIKKEVIKIAREFNLGKVKNFELIKGGLVNYNYILKTDKGKYIIRIIGDKSINKMKHLKLQFHVVHFLKENNFPYLLPYPIKTNDSKEIINIRGKKIWIYEMIKGSNYDRPNISQMKQMAKVLATYHKYMKKFKGKGKRDNAKKRILEGFKKMENIKIKDEADMLALKYRDYFKEIFNKVKNIDFSINQLFIHGDFDSTNVLFSKGKLSAVIDFDELSYSPRIFDVAVSLRDSCYARGKLDMKKIKIFLDEYAKVIKLTKKEKSMIIPIILYANVDFFVWVYVYMKKEPENKKKYMREMIVLTKDIVENKRVIK